MQFAHAADDGLSGIRIGRNLKRRVFHCQTGQSQAHFFNVGLGFRFNRQFNNRIRKFHVFQNDRISLVAQSVTGGSILQTGQSDNIAGIGLFEILTLVGMHQQHAADTFLFVFDRVVDIGTGLHGARIDADESQRTDERVVHDLKSQSRQRFFVIGVTNDHFIAAGFNPFGRRNVERRRQIVDNRVQKRLNAFVLESGTAANRNEALRQSPLADALFQGFYRNFLAFQVIFHSLFVFFDRHFNHFGMILLGFFFQIGRNILNFDRRIGCITGIDDCLHLQQIDNAAEFRFGADRQLNGHRAGAQTVFDHIQTAVEVGADTVHLVAEANSRNLVFIGLTPYGFGLRFDTGNRIENGDGTVEHAERAFDFNREVNVSRGIDKIDSVSFPEAGGGSRSNGNAAFLFLFHPVHGGGAFVYLTDLVGLTGIVKNAFAGGGFTGINMRHDTDVSV